MTTKHTLPPEVLAQFKAWGRQGGAKVKGASKKRPAAHYARMVAIRKANREARKPV